MSGPQVRSSFFITIDSEFGGLTRDKAFGRGVNRDDVRKGAEELGIPIEEHIAFCIAAMRAVADTLGSRGKQ